MATRLSIGQLRILRELSHLRVAPYSLLRKWDQRPIASLYYRGLISLSPTRKTLSLTYAGELLLAELKEHPLTRKIDSPKLFTLRRAKHP